MKIGTLSVLTLSVLALSACGGGGSSGTSTTPTVANVVQPITNTNPNQPATNTNPNQPATNTNSNQPNNTINGSNTQPNGSAGNTNNSNHGANVVQPTGANVAFDPSKMTDNPVADPISGQHWQATHTKDVSKYTLNNTNVGDNITQIVVSGQTFDLKDTGGLVYLGDDKLGVKYGTTAHSRFGVGWKADDANTIFYQGYQTLPKDMPTTDTAKYVGQAFHDCATCGDSEAKASFDVDFGKKTVAGVIDHKAQKVNLSATISGSSFSGVANGVQANGAFYGVDASELSGIYKETGGKFAGAFGATKAE